MNSLENCSVLCIPSVCPPLRCVLMHNARVGWGVERLLPTLARLRPQRGPRLDRRQCLVSRSVVFNLLCVLALGPVSPKGCHMVTCPDSAVFEGSL